MKCEECIKEGKKSLVYVGGGMTTDMYFQPFYDESGEYHNHDGNAISTDYRCSNGHSWTGSRHKKCPNQKCDWNQL